MNRPLFRSFLLIVVGLMLSVNALASSPDAVVRTTFDDIVADIQANRVTYEQNTPALYRMLETKLVPSLNIPFMVDLILGKELATTTPGTKRDELANEFKQLLLRTYATGILYATGDEKVVYEPLSLAPNAYKADVKVKLITAEGEEFPIKLQMTTRKSRWSKENTPRWRAYNLEVAGQNIARLYKQTFAGTLQTKGVDGLIADLRAKRQSS